MEETQQNAADMAPLASNDVTKFVDQMMKVTQQHSLDLSSDEDLGIALMNLISIEEHLFFTASKTGKAYYLEALGEIREMRKELLKKIIVSFEGEVWCISKHLLASSMRLMEVGTKELKTGGLGSAQTYFDKSYRLFRMFWELNLRQPANPGDAPSGPLPTKQSAVFFYEPTCPHCKKLDEFLARNALYEVFDVQKKDVTSNPANRAEMEAVHKNCLAGAGERVVPMVTLNGKCAMGEEDTIRLFKSVMWDSVGALKQSMGPLLEQAGVPAHVKLHAGRYSDAVDAALNCCKE